MKTLNVVAVVAACAALGACATNVGNPAVNDFGLYQQLENGQTTKRAVFDLFGQPHTVNYVDQTGESVWQYYQVVSRTNPTTYIPFLGLATGGSDLDITRADFFFDPEDVLIRSSRNERSRYQNQWLGMADAATPSGQVAAVEAEMKRLDLPFDRREAQIAAGWADWDD